jgi:hypothetical protein
MSSSLHVNPSEADLSIHDGSDAQTVEGCLGGDQKAGSAEVAAFGLPLRFLT